MLKGNRERIRGKGVGKRKSDVASIGRKLKLHLLVYIIDANENFRVY
jgi:hypothetical protein